MRVKQYLRNQLPVIFIHVLGMLALALFLLANGNAVQTVLFILMVWLLVLLSYLVIVCCMQKTRLNKLLGVWFGLPVLVAVIVAAVVIAYFVQSISAEISAYIGVTALLLQAGTTVSILAGLFLCYFISTWILFSRSIHS